MVEIKIARQREAMQIKKEKPPRLNVLELQKRIRALPKVVIAMVNGYAIGGGHILHLVCDLTIASEEWPFLVRPAPRLVVLMQVLVLHT